MNLFQRAFHLAHYIFPQGGVCLEFGVFQGSTYCYQAKHIKKRYQNSSLIGFDSWQGLPPESSGIWIPERHAPGQYAAPKAAVVKRLNKLGIGLGDRRFRFIDGFFSKSLTKDVQSEVHDLVFVNIDVDIYSSTIELLEFLEPVLRPGVVIYWDDWKDPRDENSSEWGEHRAWSEWMAKQVGFSVELLECNSINQRTMIVTEANGRKLLPPAPKMSEIRYHAFFELDVTSNSHLEFGEKLKKAIIAAPLVGPLISAAAAQKNKK